MQEQQSAHPKSSSKDSGEDEVLREVYAARDDYAAEHGHDLDQIYADLKRREANSLLRRFDSESLVQG
jgi:hypothetical protein